MFAFGGALYPAQQEFVADCRALHIGVVGGTDI